MSYNIFVDLYLVCLASSVKVMSSCDLLWKPKIKGIVNTKHMLNGPP